MLTIAVKTRTKTFPIGNKRKDAIMSGAQFGIHFLWHLLKLFALHTCSVVMKFLTCWPIWNLNIGELILSTDDTDMGYGIRIRREISKNLNILHQNSKKFEVRYEKFWPKIWELKKKMEHTHNTQSSLKIEAAVSEMCYRYALSCEGTFHLSTVLVAMQRWQNNTLESFTSFTLVKFNPYEWEKFYLFTSVKPVYRLEM